MAQYPQLEGIEIKGEYRPEWAEIITPEAVAFFAKLQRKHNARRKELLQKRVERQVRLDAGELPDFLPETKEIRESAWTVAPVPADIQDRRVEITGPVDRKMIINALNSGAKVFMADFEDSNAPTWENNIQGQVNLRDANRKAISFVNEANGKEYKLNEKHAALFVRPRGWHLLEKHVIVDGEEVSGGIWDFALYFFHNVKQRLENGSGLYLYLPKMESHLEARLWNAIFVDAQNELGVPQGTVKATVLIETIVATFELNEILYELKEHSAGLNCGRWDYIFSFIKRTVKNKAFLVPDRTQVTMTTHFLKSYSELVIQTCHKREAFAMGGMAAQIPIKDNPEANEIALAKVRADKEREAKAGHDGTWVAHPGLVQIAMDIFNEYMPTPNQIFNKREDVHVTAADLLKVPEGTITLGGLKNNIDVGIQYLEAWLRGNGCVPIHNLMEDAATAEISRTQVWQWVHHEDAKLDDGTKVTKELVQKLIDEQKEAYKTSFGDKYAATKFDLAIDLFTKMSLQDTLEEFLTLEAYNYID
ncbi:MAG TPA: malate synthase A [Chitinophagales bacterium]|nr:malate synthase A [Chitinophagales bacterium]HMZ69523.1 malate synthase A [Chitinophagales bacterium]HMZ94252.1 malate synthase A [Chitinophagales bacterium]HNG09343.1 malate synthase A [Chitinophagales bacterium]HNO48189.1 malate synthase A [Chitinophagales bacterium]